MAQNKSARNEFGTPQLLVARIALPPDNIVVNRVILPPDSRLHRCHSLQWSGDSFNPGRDLQSWEYGARFSSFKDDAGQYVPWLYAAGSLQGALAETVFHDLIGEARTGFLSLRPFRNWGYTELASIRKLQLASLKSQDLYRMGTSKADLIESGRLLYTQTRLWARAIYLQHSDIDGLVWKS
ncbi:RES domain-containing protein, partial [Klebsiella aerogenes]